MNLVHCINCVIFGALGDHQARSWLVTLGGCRLLDGLVVIPVELFLGDCEEAAVELVRGLVLASPEW